jgi:hypothetical protein
MQSSSGITGASFPVSEVIVAVVFLLVVVFGIWAARKMRRKNSN